MIAITAAVSLAALLIIGWTLYGVFARVHAPPTPFASKASLSAYAAECAKLPEMCEAAGVFSDSAKELLATFRASQAALDTKATGILGFVGGGTSAVALAGTTVSKTLAITPLLVVTAAMLVGVLALAVCALYPRSSGEPDVHAVSDMSIISAANGKPYMQAWMGAQYLEAARQQVAIVAKKSYFVSGAFALFALAVATLVFNFFQRT